MQIIKNIGEFILSSLLGLSFLCIPILCIYAIIFIGNTLFNFEDFIVSPAINGNYFPIITFLISVVIIIIIVDIISMIGIKDTYNSKVGKTKEQYKTKEHTLNREHQIRLNRLDDKEKE